MLEVSYRTQEVANLHVVYMYCYRYRYISLSILMKVDEDGWTVRKGVHCDKVRCTYCTRLDSRYLDASSQSPTPISLTKV